ncbi:MAG TPA: hypothetical protein PKC18_07275 [Lacipirellulaceae bacterium]|nr:hypothetical protein [Lacipirellulaceae bacterium]
MTSDVLLWVSLTALVATGLVSLGYRALREFSRRDLEEICRRRGVP